MRHLGIAAPYAAFYGVVAAFIVSCLAFGMPWASAVSAFALGSLSGFLGIIWIVLGAMFLYTMTVITGKFEIVKESIIHISFDRRLQVLLTAFSFGAIIEGTSGFGTPVAIAGAVMVGLGFSPFQSAVLNLLANTAPVAWGAIGTPIVTLAAISGLWRPAAAHRHGGGPGRGGQDPRAPGPAPPGGLSGAGPPSADLPAPAPSHQSNPPNLGVGLCPSKRVLTAPRPPAHHCR